MAEIENVIKGLRKLQGHFRAMAGIASSRQGQKNHIESARMIGDALALLEKLGPRVMTLEEAKSAFVIEYRSGKLKEAGMTILDLDVDPANAYYGEIYRVWTSRPTDEQREAEPWA